MKEITLEELLEAGCHFGHQVTRQNPKARGFIFEARDNIHIIDLAKTKEGLDAAIEFVKTLSKNKGNLLVVGTKRQAKPIIEEAVKKALEETNASEKKEGEEGLYCVTTRWMGGTLTNFPEMSKNYKKLKDITDLLADEEEKAKYTKRELGLFEKERQKMIHFYGGVMNMKQLPDALFIVDTHLEYLSAKEALNTTIPTVGIVDTNADPYLIDYPIPANDDALGSIRIIVNAIIEAWVEGRKSSETSKETDMGVAASNEEKKTITKTKRAAKTKTTTESKEKGDDSKSRTTKKA